MKPPPPVPRPRQPRKSLTRPRSSLDFLAACSAARVTTRQPRKTRRPSQSPQPTSQRRRTSPRRRPNKPLNLTSQPPPHRMLHCFCAQWQTRRSQAWVSPSTPPNGFAMTSPILRFSVSARRRTPMLPSQRRRHPPKRTTRRQSPRKTRNPKLKSPNRRPRRNGSSTSPSP